ncbi:MAG TPA: FAD-dependent oxidoreductase, partial [Alphaproteobacteria bacterium]|nr:FAD-dependent oxidoreductase [Alphaproteobacteria bacterium]
EKGLISCTVRIRQESGYKKTLDELKIGDKIEGEGPNGTLILDENEQNKTHIFLAGGIGITPFRSFIKYNIDKQLKIPMYLIYSNSDSDFVFKKELETWQKEYDYIKVEFFDTSKSGHLDSEKVLELIGNWKLEIGNSVFWTVGPPGFTNAMEEVLEKLKVKSDNIREEKFTGY